MGYSYFSPLASAKGYFAAGSEPASSVDWTDVLAIHHAAYCIAIGIE